LFFLPHGKKNKKAASVTLDADYLKNAVDSPDTLSVNRVFKFISINFHSYRPLMSLSPPIQM
jgi:hypothetical protein